MVSQSRTVAAVLFLFALSFCLFAIQSGDVFMYLALARDFLLQWDWSSTDPYLYSLPGAQLVWAHEYLSYALFYGAYATAGFAGLTLLKTCILALIFFLVLRSHPRALDGPELWIGLWVLAVLAGSFRFIERSSLFSDLFCVLLVSWLLEQRLITRSFILRLTALFFIWVQLHPGFPLGLALLSIWCLWQAAFNPQLRRRDFLWLVFPVAAIVMNPLGFEGALYPFRFALNEAQTLKRFNFEWMPAYHRAFRFAPEVIAFWVLSAVSLALIARERAWLSLRTWLAVAAMGFAVSAVRFIPWASFAIAMSLKPWCSLRVVRLRPLHLKLFLVALLALSAKNLIAGYHASSGARHPGFGLDPAYFPGETLRFLKEKPIPGRVYNSHDFGAYMIWEGFRPVFHHGFVTDMTFYRDDVVGVFQSQQRFLELAAKHGWTMLLIEKHNSYAYFWKILSPLPDWRIVAEDEAAYLIYLLPD